MPLPMRPFRPIPVFILPMPMHVLRTDLLTMLGPPPAQAHPSCSGPDLQLISKISECIGPEPTQLPALIPLLMRSPLVPPIARWPTAAIEPLIAGPRI
jgi:hypothetical protein